MNTIQTPIQKAVDLMGGPSKAAAALGVTVQAVCFWRDGQREVRPEICSAIEHETGRAVTCEDLRPDLAEHWEYLRNTSKAA